MTATLNLIALAYSLGLISVGFIIFKCNLEKTRNFVFYSNLSLSILLLFSSLMNFRCTELLQTLATMIFSLLIYALLVNIILGTFSKADWLKTNAQDYS